MKFGLGLLQAGLGFMVVVWGVNSGMVNSAFQMPLILLAVLYLLHTTGELFLSPVGLSEITKLSMPSVVSLHDGGLVPVQLHRPVRRRQDRRRHGHRDGRRPGAGPGGRPGHLARTASSRWAMRA
jgi:hypothetical protein